MGGGGGGGHRVDYLVHFRDALLLFIFLLYNKINKAHGSGDPSRYTKEENLWCPASYSAAKSKVDNINNFCTSYFISKKLYFNNKLAAKFHIELAFLEMLSSTIL